MNVLFHPNAREARRRSFGLSHPEIGYRPELRVPRPIA
jgi:hypothetical protein